MDETSNQLGDERVVINVSELVERQNLTRELHEQVSKYQQESGGTVSELESDTEVRRASGGLSASISIELVSRLESLLRSIDTRTAGSTNPMAGREIREVRSGRETAFRGRMDNSSGIRVIPLRVARSDDKGNTDADGRSGAGGVSGSFQNTLYQSAWHGSPHKFDKFFLDAIGTGKGAQAHGWIEKTQEYRQEIGVEEELLT